MSESKAVVVAIVDPPSAADDAAVRSVSEFMTSELARVQARSEKWLTGVTALTGLISFLGLVQDSGDISRLDNHWGSFRLSFLTPLVALMLSAVAAFGLFAFAIFSSYSAAFGTPWRRDRFALLQHQFQCDPTGASATLRDTVSLAVHDSHKYLARAVAATFGGLTFVLSGLAIVWLVPVADQTEVSTGVCIETLNGVVKLTGTSPTVEAGELTVVPCH